MLEIITTAIRDTTLATIHFASIGVLLFTAYVLLG
jgi:hypothetical protein